MTIKFIPSDKGVILEEREQQDKLVLSMLRCIFNKLNRLELQLEFLTDEKIENGDGDIL